MPSARVIVIVLAALLAGVAAAAAAVMLVGGDDSRSAETAATDASQPLSGPEVRFSGADVTTGAVVGLGKLEGKPVVVTVWASWCAACPKQAEPLRRFVAANNRVAVLAVDTQEDAEAARAFLTANDLSLPTIADEDGQYRGEARRPRAADDALSDERPSGRDHVGRPGRDRAPQIGRARRRPCRD